MKYRIALFVWMAKATSALGLAAMMALGLPTQVQASERGNSATSQSSLACPLNQTSIDLTTDEILHPSKGSDSYSIQDIQEDPDYRSTVLQPADWESIRKEFLSKAATSGNLEALLNKIIQIYLDKQLITSRAYIRRSKSSLEQGKIVIFFVEGRLGHVDIDWTTQSPRRVGLDYICQRVQLADAIPLNIERLEDQLRLLRNDPLFENIEASLKATQTFGATALNVMVTESEPFVGTVSIDNYSPPSVGGEQTTLSLSHRNLTGVGDVISAVYTRSIVGGVNNLDFSYSIPLNPMEGRLNLRVGLSRSRIIQPPFDQFNIRADSELYELGFRQPLWRSPSEEFALSLALSHRNGQTFVFNNLPVAFGQGPDVNGVSRVTVLRFAPEWVSRDEQGAWSLRSQFNLGLGLFNATVNDSPVPDSRFFSWLGQVQRVQRLGGDHLMIFQLDLQLTPDSLLPSEQFAIGGGQALRGYRQNVRSGDNGVRFAVEDRITIQRNGAGIPTLQVIPLINLGAVWNSDNNPNVLPNQNFLASAGLGLLWTPTDRWMIRLDYALPLVNLSDRGSNVQDDGLYFSLGYKF